MNRHILNSSSRCEHLTRSGRRCRLRAPAGSKFCGRHATVAQDPAEADLSDTLTSGLDKFDSPAAINDFLSRLLLLLAQDRISPRRAAVLAYVTNQILHTVSAMEQEAAAKNLAQPTIIWNLPGPPREQEDQPPCP
jgi:hypothetical protein